MSKLKGYDDRLRGQLEIVRQLRQKLATLLGAAQAIAIALKEPSGGEYWTARKFLDERNIYHGDLQNDRVLLRVAEAAIAAAEEP